MLRLTIAAILIVFFAGCKDGQRAEQATSSGSSVEEGAKAEIQWKTSWDESVEAAKKKSRNILILFTNPDYCPPCRMMEEQTWPDESVAEFVNANFIPLMIHTGRSSERRLADEFPFEGIPTTFIVNTRKEIIAKKTGFAPPEDFLEFLNAAKSVEDLEREAEEEDGDVAHVFSLAEAYVELGRMDDASGLLEKVCELDNDNSAGKKAGALYLLGTIEIEDRNLEGAAEYFREAGDIDPETLGDYAEENALQLAVLPANAQDFDTAVSGLKAFLKDFPEGELRAEALFYLGSCQAATGNKADAREALEKLIQDYPESMPAKYAKEHLDELAPAAD
ncbi:MAG: tetratricopeptide repeat protein [Kiritimatiellia bacterium]